MLPVAGSQNNNKSAETYRTRCLHAWKPQPGMSYCITYAVQSRETSVWFQGMIEKYLPTHFKNTFWFYTEDENTIPANSCSLLGGVQRAGKISHEMDFQFLFSSLHPSLCTRPPPLTSVSKFFLSDLGVGVVPGNS